MDLSEKNFYTKFPPASALGVRKLYRYMSCSDDVYSRIENILLDRKLYHGTSEQMNDPWDCRANIPVPKNSQERYAIKRYLEAGIPKNTPVSRSQAKLAVSKILANPSNLMDGINRIFEDSISEVRICSFSKDCSNPLLWAHYADSYKGICIEFDVTSKSSIRAQKVHYQGDYPIVGYPLQSIYEPLKAVLTKGIAWEYENEFRSIYYPSYEKPEGDGKSIKLGNTDVTGIYLGPRATDENRCKLMETIRDSEYSPKLFRSKIAKDSYSLHFSEVKVI